MIYFGTDGIRGVANETITPELATKCGNALSWLGNKILLGRDTRQSGNMLASCLIGGCLAGGSDVIDVGILPTPAIAYLTKKYHCDFGVVISASHNPPKYNGIKIFDKNGLKVDEKHEAQIESLFAKTRIASSHNIGRVTNIDGVAPYADFLLSTIDKPLSHLKIALDCSNGATSVVAKQVYGQLGAKVFCFCDQADGKNINVNCGSLHPQFLSQKVLQLGCDVGFCFDGDGDRLVAIDQNGNIINGDEILYILAKHLKAQNKLAHNIAVGTHHTNFGIEVALNKLDITLLRADVGDKYVCHVMQQNGACLGGEQSGHIITPYLQTGDGLLTSLQICKLLASANASVLCDAPLYPQTNVDVFVKDKMQVINNQKLWQTVSAIKANFEGRILVRASGTEPKVRIMAECQDRQKSIYIAKQIEDVVKQIEK